MYFIDVDTVNAGIPYADSFYVDLSYCISKYIGEEINPHCSIGPLKQKNKDGARLTVFAAIKYKKTVWGLVKSKCAYRNNGRVSV